MKVFTSSLSSFISLFLYYNLHGLSHGGWKNSMKVLTSSLLASSGRSNIKTTSLHDHFCSFEEIAPTTVSKLNVRAGIILRSNFATYIMLYFLCVCGKEKDLIERKRTRKTQRIMIFCLKLTAHHLNSCHADQYITNFDSPLHICHSSFDYVLNKTTFTSFDFFKNDSERRRSSH